MKSKYYWYDFTVRGERYRGSTKEANETRAQKAAALKLAAAIKGSDPLDKKPPTLREYSKDFLQWVETGRLEADSRRYYRNGWRLLGQTKIAGMRMDQITKDEVEKLKFPGSASNGNNALRTLRRMFTKSKEGKLILEVPDFALFKEHGRSLRLNDEAERSEGWVWKSRYKGKHIGEGLVYRQWARAGQAAGLPRELVLYCARHDFGSFVLAKTGNLKAVMNAMGHGDVRSAMVYQHPEGEIIRNALNARHISRPTVPNDNQVTA